MTNRQARTQIAIIVAIAALIVGIGMSILSLPGYGLPAIDPNAPDAYARCVTAGHKDCCAYLPQEAACHYVVTPTPMPDWMLEWIAEQEE